MTAAAERYAGLAMSARALARVHPPARALWWDAAARAARELGKPGAWSETAACLLLAAVRPENDDGEAG